MCDTPEVSISLENSDGEVERKDTNICHEDRAEEKLQVSCSSAVSNHSSSQTVLKLSFSEDQSFSREHLSSELNVSELQTGDELSLLEVPHADQSGMMETGEDCDESVEDRSEVVSCETITPCSYSEDEIEPSTDEELRLWRYPQGKVRNEENPELRLDERKDGATEGEADLESTRDENHKESDRRPGIQPDQCSAADDSTEIAGSSEMLEEGTPEDDEGRSDYPGASSTDQSSNELLGDAGPIAAIPEFEVPVRCTHSHEAEQPASKISLQRVEKDLSVSGVSPKRAQEGETEQGLVWQRAAQGDSEAVPELGGETRCLHEFQGSGPHSEGEALNEEQDGVEQLGKESVKAQEGESSKKVTFVLEPELIGKSEAETHSSGERRSSERCWWEHLGQHQYTFNFGRTCTQVKSLVPLLFLFFLHHEVLLGKLSTQVMVINHSQC